MGLMASQITSLTIDLFNRLFRRRSKKTSSKLRVTGLCTGNSPVTGEFSAQGPVTRKIFQFDDVIMVNIDPLPPDIACTKLKSCVWQCRSQLRLILILMQESLMNGTSLIIVDPNVWVMQHGLPQSDHDILAFWGHFVDIPPPDIHSVTCKTLLSCIGKTVPVLHAIDTDTYAKSAWWTGPHWCWLTL